MGGKSSKHRGGRYSSRYSSRSYGSGSSNVTSRFAPYPPEQEQVNASLARDRVKRKYSIIGDDYGSLDQVSEALAEAGLESSNLIVGIDFTKSNEWAGKLSFNRWSLHDMEHSPNPYEQAITIIGKTLSSFDEDNLIPCFGFGDATTEDQEVFSFYADNRPCNGFEEALSRYREIIPHLRLAGPTSFAPIIETAIGIVDESGGQYHVLLIIADGQVTRSVDTPDGHLSSQEKDTIDAIVKASEFPLSIVLVGVGDGPWDMMEKFDDSIPSRAFDNFQFVNFTAIISRNIPINKKETQFALAALMEIPSQYKATLDLQLLGNRKGIRRKASLPPPTRDGNTPKSSFESSKIQQIGGYRDASCSSEGSSNEKFCPVCISRAKDVAFACGHQTCHYCAEDLQFCPVCQSRVMMKIRLH